MYNEVTRVYELNAITGLWERILVDQFFGPENLDKLTPVNMAGDRSINIAIYTLTDGRFVHHVPEQPVGISGFSFEYINIDIVRKYEWESLIGERLRVRLVHFIDKDKTIFRTETYEALVTNVVPVILPKKVPQRFRITISLALKEYNSRYLPTLSDEKVTVTSWSQIDDFTVWA